MSTLWTYPSANFLYRFWKKAATDALSRRVKLYQEIYTTNSISSQMAAHYAPEIVETMFPGERPAEEERMKDEG